MTFPPDSRRVQVKICGLTNPEDALAAIALGADALGFNFYPKSSRALDLDRNAAWIRALPPGFQKIAVTVNPSRDLIDRLLTAGAADLIQLHGDEDEAFCAALARDGIPFVKAIRVRDESSLANPERFGGPAILLDAFQPGAFGGTGHRLDWALARRFVDAHGARLRVILSGGLDPDNVGEAVRDVRPAGVDVASGVERAGDARRKDPERMRAFIAAVRLAEAVLAQS